MSTAEQIIAEALVQWSLEPCCRTCAGGLAAHVVAALTNAGKQIVDQAEADALASEDEFDAWGVTIDNEPATVCALKHYRVVAVDDHIGQMSPDEARDFAAALLAAARVAEGGDQP